MSGSHGIRMHIISFTRAHLTVIQEVQPVVNNKSSVPKCHPISLSLDRLLRKSACVEEFQGGPQVLCV